MERLNKAREGIIHIIFDVDKQLTLCKFGDNDKEYEFGENINPQDCRMDGLCVAIAIPIKRKVEVELLDFRIYQK